MKEESSNALADFECRNHAMCKAMLAIDKFVSELVESKEVKAARRRCNRDNEKIYKEASVVGYHNG